MRIISCSIALLLFATLAAAAQKASTTSVQKATTKSVVILAETRTEVDKYILLEPDCTAIDLTVRITKVPAKGALEVEEGSAFTKCGRSKLPGASILFYTPKPGFKGQDRASVEVFSPRGRSFMFDYSITVK